MQSLVGKSITCISVGGYRKALTRGHMYQGIAENDRNVRVCGDNGRTRWYPKGYFDLEGKPAPTLMHWTFDAPVLDQLCSEVEITFELTDGSRRWCWLFTPGYLQQKFAEPLATPFIRANHMIVVRDLAVETVALILYEIDQAGELLAGSLLIEPMEKIIEDETLGE